MENKTLKGIISKGPLLIDDVAHFTLLLSNSSIECYSAAGYGKTIIELIKIGDSVSCTGLFHLCEMETEAKFNFCVRKIECSDVLERFKPLVLGDEREN